MEKEITKAIAKLRDAQILLAEYGTATTKMHAEQIERIINDLKKYLAEMAAQGK